MTKSKAHAPHANSRNYSIHGRERNAKETMRQLSDHVLRQHVIDWQRSGLPLPPQLEQRAREAGTL